MRQLDWSEKDTTLKTHLILGFWLVSIEIVNDLKEVIEVSVFFSSCAFRTFRCKQLWNVLSQVLWKICVNKESIRR